MASAKMLALCQRIARLRTLNIRDVAIARAINMTNSGLQRVLRTSEYLEIERCVFEGTLSKLDFEIAKNTTLLHKMIEPAVPAALQAMVDSVVQRRDLRTALAAAKEILDRDPKRTFVSASTSARTDSLPQALIESISRDADGVATSVSAKLKNLNKVDA